MKKENGITLVALIVSIIVLLILATVSISLVINNGILDKAKSAVDKYSEGEIEEQIKLAYTEWQTAQWTGETKTAQEFMEKRLQSALKDDGLTVTGSFKVTLSNGKNYFYNSSSGQIVDKEIELYPITTATSNNRVMTENSRYLSDGKTAVIPEGYTISNVENEQDIDTGLVIKKDGNEWVWIPVSSTDLTAMHTEDSTGWAMSGTEVVTQYKSNGNIILGKTRVNPGDSSACREPDTIVGTGTQYDNMQTYWKEAGFSSYLDMTIKLKDDYKCMIDSVKKYGGFYIGRYELGKNTSNNNRPQVKAGPVLNSKNWYSFYSLCKSFTDMNVESRMIWGCQWDQVCKFISNATDTNGDKIDLLDSRKYGNYSDSLSPANTNSGSGNYNSTTGRNEAWKINNIYDLAGNCIEWAQEANGTNHRTQRGGECKRSGTYLPVSSRGSWYPTTTGSTESSRPTLYIK